VSSPYVEFRYDSPAPGNGESGKRLADFLIKIIRGQRDVERICDLGCGNGYLSARLAEEGYRVTGIDASRSGIALARATHVSDRLDFICAAIEDAPRTEPPLPAGKFDLVVSSDVIEHLYRPSALLEAAAFLLRPGGRLMVGAPYHGYLKNIVLSVLDRWDRHHTVDWDGGHIKFFSVRSLKSLVAENGFTDIRFHHYGRTAWLWKNMICVARRK
jgi:SAM-dependent methyltransferase